MRRLTLVAAGVVIGVAAVLVVGAMIAAGAEDDVRWYQG